MSIRRTGLLIVAACLPALPAGCVTEKPRTHGPQTQPSRVTPTVMQTFIAQPRDTNANGYWDTIPITVYLFTEEQYSLSLAVPGRFDFKLSSRDNKPVAEWSIDEAAARESLRRMTPGPAYVLQLNLLEHGSDKLENTVYLLRGSFTPKGGLTLEAQASPIMLGRLSN